MCKHKYTDESVDVGADGTVYETCEYCGSRGPAVNECIRSCEDEQHDEWSEGGLRD